jgi:hypothetical protein
MRRTEAALAEVSLLAIWKTKSASARFWASSTSVPVSCASEVKQYTPAVSVLPPRSCPVRPKSQGSPARTS